MTMCESTFGPAAGRSNNSALPTAKSGALNRTQIECARLGSFFAFLSERLAMTLAVGTKLGRYEIRSQLGAGGMGEVYLAQDTKFDRKVALKILPAELAANHDRMRRFAQEAKAAAALNHPNIAHIYEIGESGSSPTAREGVHFIAMEFIDGVTLREVIHGGQRDLAKLLRYLQHVAEGQSEAHWIAKIYAALNEKELALTWLERGLAAGAIAVFYKDEPVWDPIRNDPRFADLLKRMGIPQ